MSIDSMIEKYCEMAAEHGKCYADLKKGLTISRFEKEYTGYMKSIMSDGSVQEIPQTYKTVTYDIKSEDGSSAKIVIDAMNNAKTTFYNKDGKAIPDPVLFNTKEIDKSKLAGYCDNARLHEQAEGYGAFIDKIKQTMSDILNCSDLKTQLKAGFDSYVLASGRVWYNSDGNTISSDEMFEQYYKRALKTTINDASLVTGSGGNSLSATGHAYAYTQEVVDAFIRNFTYALA